MKTSAFLLPAFAILCGCDLEIEKSFRESVEARMKGDFKDHVGTIVNAANIFTVDDEDRSMVVLRLSLSDGSCILVKIDPPTMVGSDSNLVTTNITYTFFHEAALEWPLEVLDKKCLPAMSKDVRVVYTWQR